MESNKYVDFAVGKDSGSTMKSSYIIGLVGFIPVSVTLLWHTLKPLMSKLLDAGFAYAASTGFDRLHRSQSFQTVMVWVVPGLISFVTFLLYRLFSYLNGLIRKRFFRSITIKNQDENYDTVLTFISKKCKIDSSAYVAETYKNKNKSWKERIDEWRTGGKNLSPKFVFKPSDDKFSVAFFRYKGCKIMMTRAPGTTVTVGWDRRPKDLESLTLTTFGTNNAVLLQLLQDALDDAKMEMCDELNVWVIGDSWLGGWEKALSKKVRPTDSVILDDDLSEKMTEDAVKFQQSAQWYTERGIPYRRGYLLYGPPGTGKTSFVQVLAGELKLDMCMLNLSDKTLNDTVLASLLRETPKNSLIMIEDIDAIFVERKKQDKDGSGGVTFSGLLNALDGVASQEGRITIMTTNHIERLDPALIRPGRIDLKIEVNNASKSQARRLFLRFFPENSLQADDFAAKIPSHEISMAAIQGHLLSHRDDPIRAVATAHDLLDSKQILGDGWMPTFDHLRRVGLERFSYAFENFGIYTKEDFDAMDIKKIKACLVDLRWDSKSCSRFEKLVDKDQDLMREYVICDVPTIKELFRTKFSGSKSDRICEILAPQGKGLCSIWQLKWFLRCWDSEDEALAHANVLIDPRDKFITRTWMTAWDFCKREGSKQFAGCAWELEENGFHFARDFVELGDEDKLKDAGFIRASAQIALAATDSDNMKHLHVKMKFCLLDYVLAKKEFLNVYNGADEALAAKFAHAITDRNGFGLVSHGEVAAFFAKHVNDPQVACDTASYLIDYKRDPKPEPEKEEETKGWIVDFLKTGSADLVEYADKFIEQEINAPIDVIGISDSELSRIFQVEKLGHRKLILRLIKGLESAEEKYKTESCGGAEEKKVADRV